MKKTILVYVCWLTTLICSAQKLTQEQFFLSKGLFDFQAGIALPAGDFALSSPVLPAGYAKTGYNIKAGLNYDIAPFIGLALQYQYVQNPYNSSDLLSDLQHLSGSFDVTYNSYSSDPWKLHGVLAGFYYPFKAYKTTIDLRLLGGFFTGVLPESEQNFTRPSLNRTYNFKQIENRTSDLGFQAGFKIRYQLYEQLVLSGSIDYTQTTLSFEDIRYVETYSNTPFKGDDYSQKFQIFNFSLGLGIQFD